MGYTISFICLKPPQKMIEICTWNYLLFQHVKEDIEAIIYRPKVSKSTFFKYRTILIFRKTNFYSYLMKHCKIIKNILLTF